ncbi:MAG: hypothetical protein KIH01_02050 [Candidatus Freyarchaeota archaeon]|nr:hypothetical protein [Candidatus Jordarchaeia archaeon]
MSPVSALHGGGWQGTSVPHIAGEGYDPEFEYYMARLGMRFRCSVCGRMHHPGKKSWRNCFVKVASLVNDCLFRDNILWEMSKFLDKCTLTVGLPDKRLVRILLKGERAFRIAGKMAGWLAKKYAARLGFDTQEFTKRRAYLDNPQALYLKISDPFRMLVKADCFVNLAKAYAEMVETANRLILKAVEKLPDAKVEEIIRNRDGGITEVNVGGLLLPGSVLEEVFSEAKRVGHRSRGEYVSVTFYQVDESLSYAVIYRELYRIKCARNVKVSGGWILASREGVIAELSPEEASLDISALIVKHSGSS